MEGSIWGGMGWDGGSTELRRRPAMVAANVASLMVLGNGGWVVEGQQKVENVVGCLDCRMGRRREELGVQGRRWRQWRAARCVTGGRRLVLAREVGRCPFIVAAREGEAGRTLAGGGPPGAARAGACSDRRGRRRGEQRTRRGACRAQVAPEGSGFGKTRGARGGFGLGAAKWPARWRRRRTAPLLRREGERTEEEEAVSGSFVNRPKFQNPVL